MASDWCGKRVTVMGLGRFGGGVGVTRWLVQQGARVTVTDRDPESRLADSVAQLRDLDVAFTLGRHELCDFLHADAVVVNPAVPDSSEFLAAARAAHVPITTEINLFLELNPAMTVGVTGTVGKSTTVAMIGRILQAAAGEEHVWVGGNIGRSLLDELPRIRPDDYVVLELSSFQLCRTAEIRWSPRVGVFTSLAPNHLDWHGTYSHYVASKLNLIRFQDPARDAIVIPEDPQLRRHFDLLHGDLAGIWRFHADSRECSARMQSGSAMEADDRMLSWNDLELPVPGVHNRLNAAAALTAAHVLRMDREAALRALKSFDALPHRLQPVGLVSGVRYFNDSKSTTPEAALTALAAFDGPVLMILGGYDKQADLSELCRVAAGRSKYCACIGQTGPALLDALRSRGGRAELHADLSAAVAACRRFASPGDVVLLSPACASWGQFTDYRERGDRFSELVRRMRQITDSPTATTVS